ncbi:MAG: hypothetical protein HRU09_11910 [Oligoflexales bacterium]|nr:hypothetical protein [Oligoflexales bacterium]
MEANETQNQSGEPQEAKPVSKAKGKKAKTGNDELKLRLVLNAPEGHPFPQFLNEIKQRGVKSFDPGEFILKTLAEFPDEWWEEKIEGLTPLEFKINKALSDPDMREKLTMLLASEKLEDRGDSPLHS